MVAVVVLVGAALGVCWVLVGLMGDGINKLSLGLSGRGSSGGGVWSGLEGEGLVDLCE